MTFDPDINDDVLLVDGLETVSLVGASTVVVAGAKRGPIANVRSQLNASILEVADVVWLLPQINLGGVVPQVGDTITDAANISWTIMSTSFSPLTQVWQAIGCKQR